MTREELVGMARKVCDQAIGDLPPEVQVVIVVTDSVGEWVGVSSSAGDFDTQEILQSALDASGRIDH